MIRSVGWKSLAAVLTLAGTAAGAWTKSSAWTESKAADQTGDLVGNNGFREAWIVVSNGSVWGRHGCACSGHSFGPAGADVWDSSVDNSLTSTWHDSDGSGGSADVRFQVAYQNRHLGSSSVQNGATYAGVFITRVKQVVARIDELVVYEEWLGVNTNKVSTLQGNDSFDSTTPITLVVEEDGSVASGQTLSISVEVFTHVDYEGAHPPQVSSHFAAVAEAEQKVLLASRKL